MRKLFVILLVAFIPIFSLNAEIIDCQPLFGDVMKQYMKAEWNISLIEKWDNPYDQEQIALDMIFISPDGSKGVLPCFFVDGESGKQSLWKARFAAKQTGVYQIYFELRCKNKLVSTTRKQNVECVSSSSKGFLSLNDNWTFRFDNGDLFRAIGENIGWESRNVDDSKYFKNLHEDKRFNYDYMIPKLAKSGGNFFRTWMIYWNLPVDWKQVKNNNRYTSTTSFYNESAMQRLDHLVDLCDSLGVYMMLALESHVGYMGDGWKMNNYNVANGGFATTPADFFSSDKARAQYKNKLRLMIARYGYSPSIAVWEFFNEVDHVAFDKSFGNEIPTTLIADWHREMAMYLKKNDPYNHLVSTSVSHRDMDGMNDIDAMDFNQRHIYGNAFTIPNVIRDYEAKHNKPYVIGECGYHWDWSLNFNDYLTEFTRDFRKTLWLGLFSPTPILPMSWWWEFFENNGMMGYFSKVKVINQEILASLQGDALKEVKVNSSSSSLVGLGLKSGHKIFAYLYNNGEADYTKNVIFEGIESGIYQVESYCTITGKRSMLNSSLQVSENKLVVPCVGLAPQQDYVLICSKLEQRVGFPSSIVYDTNKTEGYFFPTHNNLLVMDRAYATATEVFVVEIEPGKATHRHIHNDTEQLYYVLSGKGRVDLERNGKKEQYEILPTQLVHIPLNCYHQTFCSGDEVLRYLAVDCFPGGKNQAEPTWDSHAHAICDMNGWDYEQSRKEPFYKPTTGETRKYLSDLKDMVGKGFMFGHQDASLYGIGWKFEQDKSDVKSVCGDFPAIIGFDLGRIELGSIENLDGVPFELMRKEIIKQYERGGFSTISWHVTNPKTGESAWDNSDTTVVASILPGGRHHQKFVLWMDRVADFFLSLKTEEGKKVPVLFRPWHEHTGSWFWWGEALCSAQEYKSLWVMLCEHLKSRGVDNVLYAYSTGIEPMNTEEYLAKYPGDDYIDLLGFDYYQSKHDEYVDNMKRLLNIITEIGQKKNKPIAVTETGFGGLKDKKWWTETLFPILKEYPLSYVLVWRNADDMSGHYFAPYPGQLSAKDFIKFYHLPQTLFLQDLNKK